MDRINFKVNDKHCSVGCEVSSKMTMLDYIRNTLELRGTKYMCREAGCGACIVTVAKCPEAPLQAVNSCMVSITSCQDWEITTIEGLGNRKKGYHVLQKTLAEHNGSQCGYCSPGWVMAMHGLLESRKELTMKDIERASGSNICRCTGYRPILDALKTFATDTPTPNKLLDIEDLYICKKSETPCEKKYCDDDDNWCVVTYDNVEQDRVLKINLSDNKVWYRARNLEDIFNIVQENSNCSNMLVSGNTAKGAYPISEYPPVLIDISQLRELKGCYLDQNLMVGSGVTLTQLMGVFQDISQQECFAYLKTLNDHLQNVAHVSVRNLGTVGGNLMIKHEHREFPSDVYLMLETVGAELCVSEETTEKYTGRVQILTMQNFLNTDMKNRIVIKVLLPPLSNKYKIVFFKVMPRSQCAPAIVNAGFGYQLTENSTVKECRIVYGGLSPQFTRAVATEAFLVGRKLFTNETLQRALRILENELTVTEIPPKPSAKYRKQLALGLFYKGLLSLCSKDQVSDRYFSGATKIHETRPVSKAKQFYETEPSQWPLTQPVEKVEALIQCAGETIYTDDMVSLPNEIYAAFVLSTVAIGDIVSIDPSKALEKPGVLGFYSAKDIPGLNSFTPSDATFYSSDEEVFCSSTVKYYNQPLGAVAATTQAIADTAAKLVAVKYANVKKPILTITEAKKHPERVKLFTSIEATHKGDDVVKVIKGSNSTYGQYHHAMENLACIVKSSEEGLTVNAASQWLDGTQVMISRALNIDQNRIDIHTRRLGGGFGIKISAAIQSAVACSLIALKLNRPCRFLVPMSTTIRALGKRLPSHTDFEVRYVLPTEVLGMKETVGVNKAGVIQYINYDIYQDNGYKLNETFGPLGTDMFYNCYNKSSWNYRNFDVTTNTPKNTWCRAPIYLENVAMAENVMEQIAYELGLDPLSVRLANVPEEYKEIKEMVASLKKNSKYAERRKIVNEFNAKNRWKKRGLRFSLMRWSPVPFGSLEVHISVYHADGTVVITHGGIEMGQGINTKAIQICSYMLNIPMEKIQIKENNTVLGPNVFLTGGSLTSQNVGVGIQKCCLELLEKLEPIRKELGDATWEDLIKKAFDSNIDLQIHSFVSPEDSAQFMYIVYGVALAEVEVDILTGESEVLRVDLEEDVGRSISPGIDIGQVEGAFIMGQGYWTSEELVFDKNTGELLTDRVWTYMVPISTDIPQNLNIYFRKNSYSFKNIFGTKAIGEPPICLSVVITLALREAISSARFDSGIPSNQWFTIDAPYTVERIALATSTNCKDFKYS